MTKSPCLAATAAGAAYCGDLCSPFEPRRTGSGFVRDGAIPASGQHPGLAGEIYLCWRRGVQRPVSVKTLRRALPDVELEQIGEWLDAGQGAPIPRAASVLQAVVEER